MKRAARSPRRRAAGLTLLELLIAISLMAVLAVLGWRGLDTVLGSRERIVETSDGLRALSVGFAQIDEDLRRAWPVRLLNLALPSIGFVQTTPEGPPALQMLRELPPGSGVPQVQRVIYRLRDGVLERGFAPWGSAPAGAAAEAAAPMVWQPLVSGVANLQMRGWLAGQGWVPASAMVLRPGAPAAAVPVTGVELLIERVSGERIVRIFAVRD